MQRLNIEGLEQWVVAGGTWRVVDISHDQVVVDFCACTGEPMQRLCSWDPEVIAWIQAAPRPERDDE